MRQHPSWERNIISLDNNVCSKTDTHPISGFTNLQNMHIMPTIMGYRNEHSKFRDLLIAVFRSLTVPACRLSERRKRPFEHTYVIRPDFQSRNSRYFRPTAALWLREAKNALRLRRFFHQNLSALVNFLAAQTAAGFYAQKLWNVNKWKTSLWRSVLRQGVPKRSDFSRGDSGTGVDSDLNINEYQGYFLGAKAL
jgi:hypothetical protein